jgi:type IV pilus assembly protein PilO
MNELFERILELPTRQRVVILVGSVGFLVFLYAQFIYWPRSEMIAEKEDAVARLQTERNHKAALVANIEDARKEVMQLEGDLRKAVAQLPDTKEIPDLLSTISALGREPGLEIIQFKQRPEEYDEFYARVPVDIVVRGTFHQVERFFESVGRMARIVNVTDVGIKSPKKLEGDSVTLDTSCVAVTFRFLDEEERERIAQQKKEQEKKGGRR